MVAVRAVLVAAVLLFVAVQAAAAAVVPVTPVVDVDEDVDVRFTSWAKQHGRRYSTASERAFRRGVFAENLARVAQARANERGTAQYEMNEFADQSREEFATRLLSCPGVARDRHRVPSERARDLSADELAAAPEAWDWRDHGAVNAVRNQGSCGSCWAFSVMAALEATHFQDSGSLVSLSTEQLVQCGRSIILDGKVWACCGCLGAWPVAALEYLKTHGAQSEASYPYCVPYCYEKIVNLNGTEPCGEPHWWNVTCSYDATKAETYVREYQHVPADEEQIVGYSAKGVLSTLMNAEWMQFYKGGISDPWVCGDGADHAVNIVGYGQEHGKNYWIIRNSWGADWGESGYMRLVRGKKKCGIANNNIWISATHT